VRRGEFRLAERQVHAKRKDRIDEAVGVSHADVSVTDEVVDLERVVRNDVNVLDELEFGVDVAIARDSVSRSSRRMKAAFVSRLSR
jgi:hypothetical protein